MHTTINKAIEMGAELTGPINGPRTLMSIICKCNHLQIVTAGAIYRQWRRGRTEYMCPSCAGKAGWTKTKRRIASLKSKAQWLDNNYIGTIIGKAMANDIKRLTKTD